MHHLPFPIVPPQRWLAAMVFLTLFMVPGTGFGQQAALSVSVTSTNPSCAVKFQPGNYTVLGDGSITATASGGTPPYTYSLKLYRGPQNNGYFPGLDMGNYLVVVTDAAGATAQAATFLSYTLPQPMLAVNVLQVPSSCTSADGSLQLVPFGGTPPYTFSSDGGLSFQTATTFTGLQQGYWLTYEMKDANGCLAVVDGNTNLTCNFCCPLVIQGLIDNSPCGNDGKLSVYAQNATPPVYFSLDGINYQVANGVNQYVDTFYNLAPGVYHVYAKMNDQLITESTFILDKACSTFLGFQTTDPSCNQSDGNITVVASYGVAPYTYSMDGVHFQTSSTFSGLGAGSYGIIVKDALGKSEAGTATLVANCPKVTGTSTIATCGKNDGTITAQGAGGVSPYQYSIDGVHFQTSPIFSGLPNGNYTLTVKDNTGAMSSTQVAVQTVNCLQITTIPVSTTCGNPNGSVTVNAANGTAPYVYSIDGINFVPANIFSGLPAGPYTLTVKDAAGLSGFSQITISDMAGPEITTISTPAFCGNVAGTMTITAGGGTAPFQYSIDDGVTYQAGNQFGNIHPGQYPVRVLDANGCTVSAVQSETALPFPSVFLGNDTTLCTGDSLNLLASSAASDQVQWQDNSTLDHFLVTRPGTYMVKVTNVFQCSVSDTIQIVGKPVPVFSLGNDTVLCQGKLLKLNPQTPGGAALWNTGSTNPILTVSQAGLYWLQVTENGCVTRDSITVGYKPSPSIDLGPDTVLCEGQVLLLDVGTPNASYVWQDGSTAAVYQVSAGGNYSVKVSLGGCDTTGKITVDYTGKPVVRFTEDTTLCITQQWIIDASYPQSTYAWQDGSTQPRFTVTQAGNYSVEVTNNCGVTTAAAIVKYDNCNCKFYMPNGFTPNNDGNNDVFKPRYICLFANYELQIFGRWGELVFDSKDPGAGWDGNWKGRPQPSGTYVWMMKYLDKLTGKRFEQKGTLLLIR